MLCDENHFSSFVPLRSPIAVHSVIANMSRGLRLIEIGTRQGDTVRCYRKYASHVLAIENNPTYCKHLHSIKNIDVLCPVNAFDLRRFDADVITFWLDETLDEKMITFMLKQKRVGSLGADTRLWVLADNQLREEVLKKTRIMNTWSSNLQRVMHVNFDEFDRCLQGMKNIKKRQNYILNCKRARGTFSIMELI